MPRHSSLLATAFALCLFLPPTSTMAQAGRPLPIDVVYTLHGESLETYVINRTTGIPVLKGLKKLDLANSPIIIIPSPDDHFLYVFGFSPGSKILQLVVYRTDANGVPRNSAVQQVDFPYPPFSIDPNMRYAYSVTYDEKSQEWNFLLFPINPTTGIVQTPKLVAQESQYGPLLAMGAGQSGYLWIQPDRPST